MPEYISYESEFLPEKLKISLQKNEDILVDMHIHWPKLVFPRGEFYDEETGCRYRYYKVGKICVPDEQFIDENSYVYNRGGEKFIEWYEENMADFSDMHNLDEIKSFFNMSSLTN